MKSRGPFEDVSKRGDSLSMKIDVTIGSGQLDLISHTLTHRKHFVQIPWGNHDNHELPRLSGLEFLSAPCPHLFPRRALAAGTAAAFACSGVAGG